MSTAETTVEMVQAHREYTAERQAAPLPLDVKLSRRQAAPILARTFPNYNGRKIRVRFSPRVTFYNTNWDGGSRSRYAALNSAGTVAGLNTNMMPPWDNPVEGKALDITPNVMIIEHCIFCGKDAGITIHAHPDLAPKFAAMA